ncbi:EAL domain-containing protein [Sulfurimonas sp.]|uniref:EAL and HDOD domain-containing protein n=1 Tax=Sulfurimonas sp. TaxID=2022749 RepID=UPI00262B094B|nr:EAL domain-containing protein [Sulfurimonas sp.]
MNTLTLTKQKIFDNKKRVFAYELIFKEDSDSLSGLTSHLKEASQLIVHAISNEELNKLIGHESKVFINVDDATLTKGILDVLDNKRFILNILEDIELNDHVVSKIIQYKKRGFSISLEHFDSSADMIKKFARLFNFIDIIKMDIILSQPQNLENLVKKFRNTRIKLVAQNIETQEDYDYCLNMGMDYFQGYYLDKPQTIELAEQKEPLQFIILQLIKIIKDDNSTESLESFIRQQPDLSYKLVAFFNNMKKFDVKIESLTQVITLMGRAKLLRWLLVYLYSEASSNPASKSILELALKRAQRMEDEAAPEYKNKAYLAGMFSMLDSIFETDMRELMNHLDMDRDIRSLVLERKGIFAGSLMRAEEAEKEYLKKIMLANFDKLNANDLIITLEENGIEIDKNRF